MKQVLACHSTVLRQSLSRCKPLSIKVVVMVKERWSFAAPKHDERGPQVARQVRDEVLRLVRPPEVHGVQVALLVVVHRRREAEGDVVLVDEALQGLGLGGPLALLRVEPASGGPRSSPNPKEGRWHKDRIQIFQISTRGDPNSSRNDPDSREVPTSVDPRAPSLRLRWTSDEALGASPSGRSFPCHVQGITLLVDLPGRRTTR